MYDINKNKGNLGNNLNKRLVKHITYFIASVCVYGKNATQKHIINNLIVRIQYQISFCFVWSCSVGPIVVNGGPRVAGTCLPITGSPLIARGGKQAGMTAMPVR